MTGWGSGLVTAYANATKAAKETFDTASEAIKNTGEYIDESITKGLDYTKTKAIDAADYTRDKAIDAAKFAQDKAIEGKEFVQGKINASEKKVREFLEPRPAGQKIELCPNQSKTERVRTRLQKIDKAKAILENMKEGNRKEALRHATERFEFNNHAVERARLSDSVYGIGQNEPPEGWSRPTADELRAMGFDPRDFPITSPNFQAAKHKDGYFVEMYKTTPEMSDALDGEQYVLVFRGTQGRKDWKTNREQAIGGETEHYSKAINVANKVQERLGSKVEIAGHSLGGGMATAAGITSGTKTYTFNPAGVHPKTLERAGDFSRNDANKLIGGKPLVDNVVVPGDPLTSIQDERFQQGVVVGGAVYAPAATAGVAVANRATREQGTLSYSMAGKRHDIPFLANADEVVEATKTGKSVQGMTPGKLDLPNPIERHGMNSVIGGMEQQKADDLYKINEYVHSCFK